MTASSPPHPIPPLRLGIVYETFGTYLRRAGDPEDYEAEYEPEATIEALEAAIASAGHRPVRIGSPRNLLEAVARDELAIDVALTIAEGYGSRNREGWAPALLEMAGVPALGSDALTLGLCLDKAWTLQVVAQAGVRVAPHALFADPAEVEAGALPAPFPLFAKPRTEGTAKGIGPGSVVRDRAALARQVARIVRDYAQPALVEAFVPGAEYTVCVAGHDPPRALPVLQRALDAETGIGLHALEAPGELARTHHLPGDLTPALECELQEAAVRAFAALECLDFARADFRLDEAGRPVFLEINPLPTFAPDGSFAILAELAGRTFADYLGEILGEAVARLRLSGDPN